MERVSSAGHDEIGALPLDVIAPTTEELLAALPDSLMVPDGTTAGERRLSDVLALYRAVFVNSTEPIAIIDAAGYYIEQNVAHQALLGYTIEELRGVTPAIHMGEALFRNLVDELQRVGQVRREVVNRTKDGRETIIDLAAFTVRDRAGRPVCYVDIKRDVTAERRATTELAQRFGELQALYRVTDALAQANALDDICNEALDGLRRALGADRASILLFDGEGVMRFTHWRGLSDAYRAAVEGHSPWTQSAINPAPVTVSDVNAEPSLAALRAVITSEGIRALAFLPLSGETELLGKFMVYFDAPHVWTPAELQLAQAIARHVSFAIQRERRVMQLRAGAARQQRLFEEANEANRTKSAFLATMSHELRTPLNAIAGYTDLLDAGIHGELTAGQADALQRIQTNQRHLLRLIEDVLDFAKLEAGHLKLDITDVLVQETVDGTRALIEPQLRAKKILFDFVPGDKFMTCRADRAKTQQILANLLSNAWKFTPAGGTVSLRWDATAHEVCVHVRDTGPGISTANLERIFEPFVQLQTGFRRAVEGTGLGLAISRELARSMGGDVSAASVLGEGSTFTLTLPRHAASKAG